MKEEGAGKRVFWSASQRRCTDFDLFWLDASDPLLVDR